MYCYLNYHPITVQIYVYPITIKEKDEIVILCESPFTQDEHACCWGSADFNGKREERSFALVAVFWRRETGACKAVLWVDEHIKVVIKC